MNFVILILSLVIIGITLGNESEYDDDYDHDDDDDKNSFSVEILNHEEVSKDFIREKCAPPRKCVKHYQCYENGTVKLYGENMISFRYRSADIKRVLWRNVVLNGSMEKSDYSIQETECTKLERCCGIDAPPLPLNSTVVTNTFVNEIFEYKGCGFKNHNNRVIPWIVSLLQKNPTMSKSAFLCGGNLIHSRVILTVAHCVNRIKKSEYKVRTGGIPSQERNIIEIKLHENFYLIKLYHDIALVIVDEAFEFNVNVQPICLGEISLRSNSELACSAVTWSKEEIKSIKSVQVNVVPATRCQAELRRTRLSQNFELHRSFMCATPFEEWLTYDSDEGLSLVCPILNEANRYYQSGIVSWSTIEAGKYPDVYTDIAVHRVWINRIMTIKGFGTDSFTYTK